MNRPHELTQRQRWDAYFVDPQSQTLRNRKGITNPEVWARAESDLVAGRSSELPKFGFDKDTLAEELCAIHQYLFQDCYDWAGQYRDVDMVKSHPGIPDSEVSFSPWDSIPDQLDAIQERIDSIEWDELHLSEKKNHLAEIHAKLNYVHPFREGNGRATRAFMEEFAGRYDVDLEWDGYDDALLFASAASMMHESGLALEPWALLYEDVAEQATWHDEPIVGIDELLDTSLLGSMTPLDLSQSSYADSEQEQGQSLPESSMVNLWHSHDL